MGFAKCVFCGKEWQPQQYVWEWQEPYSNRGLCGECAEKGATVVRARGGSGNAHIASALGHTCSSTCSVEHALSGLHAKLFGGNGGEVLCLWDFAWCDPKRAVGYYAARAYDNSAPIRRAKKGG